MRVLILGGSTEATAIALALAGDPRVEPLLSFAGRTSTPVPPPIPWRSGGFGGAEGLAAFLRTQAMDALIDATHPFAARMKANAAAAATAAGVARVAVLRPAWRAGISDRWIAVPTLASAFQALGAAPRRVFLAIGRQELAAFGPPHAYLVRSIDPPDPAVLPPGATAVAGRGPFTETAERALLDAHRIETMVAKNAGGAATAAKLAAARALGVAVVMVDRPPPPAPPLVPDAAGALDWLTHQAAPSWRRGV